MDPLPPPLMKEDSSDYFSTTTGTFHNYKQNNTVLSNAIHKKAAGHWKVGYVEDVIKKVLFLSSSFIHFKFHYIQIISKVFSFVFSSENKIALIS